MTVPISPLINFVLATSGLLFSALITIIGYQWKREDRGRIRIIEEIKQKADNNWTIYFERHAALQNQVNVMQANYVMSLETLKNNITEIKLKIDIMPVLKNELDNLKYIIDDGFKQAIRRNITNN